MYTIKTMNAISPVGLAKLPANQFEINNEADDAQGILVRSADLHDVALPKSLLAIARAGAGTNNIPIDQCTEQGIVVFNTPGANANAVAELVIAFGVLLGAGRPLIELYISCLLYTSVAAAQNFLSISGLGLVKVTFIMLRYSG